MEQDKAIRLCRVWPISMRFKSLAANSEINDNQKHLQTHQTMWFLRKRKDLLIQYYSILIQYVVNGCSAYFLCLMMLTESNLNGRSINFTKCIFILPQGVVYLFIYFVHQLSDGMPLRSGQRLKYRINGELLWSDCVSAPDWKIQECPFMPRCVRFNHCYSAIIFCPSLCTTSPGFLAIVVSCIVIIAAVYQGVDFTYIHSHFLQLAMASFIISILLSVYIYVRSLFAAPGELALGGNSGKSFKVAGVTSFVHFDSCLFGISAVLCISFCLLVSSGHAVYDFFKGRELNPRIRDFDLKFFCEMRPGLIGWVSCEKTYTDTNTILSYF